MKVLSLDLHYLLPDDFEGTFEDAIEHYINYRRECGYPKNDIGTESNKKLYNKDLDLWDNFLICISETNLKSAIGGSLAKWDAEAGDWIDMMDD